MILSDLHDCFQTVTGREPEVGISDAAIRGEVCPKSPGRREKKRPVQTAGAPTAGFEYGAQAQNLRRFLEVEFQSELKLARIKCGCGPAVITTVSRSLVEGINVVEERRR